MGANFDLKDWFNVDLNVAASDKLTDTAKDAIKKLSKKTGFDFFGLFNNDDEDTLWFGMKPSTVIMGAGGLIGGIILIYAATGDGKKRA